MTREMMLDEVIRRYGFEVKQTIKFATLCESGTDEKVQAMYNKLMKQAEMPTAPFSLARGRPRLRAFYYTTSAAILSREKYEKFCTKIYPEICAFCLLYF